MVKLLFDPIVTNDPRFCSMVFKMQEASRYLLKTRDEVFIRFLLPDDQEPGANWVIDQDWLLQDPRLEYVKHSVWRDRMKEYYRFSDQLNFLTRFNGPLWDTDIVVTARIPAVAHILANLTSMRRRRVWSRKVVTVEDMPVLNFKLCVTQSQPAVQDLQHVCGYLAAHRNLFFSFWEKDAMLQVAREWLSPSRVRALAAKSFDSSPIQVQGVKLKPADFVQSTATRDKPFTVAYTQRFEAVHRRSVDVMRLFERQWVYRGGKHKMRFISTSNSRATDMVGDVDTDFIEFKRPPREEFWRMMREEVDVVVVMSIDDAYPLSMIEPLLNGTPCVILGAPYARKTIGADYPFFCDGEQTAYGLVKAFFDDYAGMYATFARWSKEKLEPLMLARNQTWFPLHLNQMIDQHIEDCRVGIGKVQVENALMDLLMARGGDEWHFEELVKRLYKAKEVGTLAEQLVGRTRMLLTSSFATCINDFRLRLIYNHGYKDAGVAPGHFARR